MSKIILLLSSVLVLMAIFSSQIEAHDSRDGKVCGIAVIRMVCPSSFAKHAETICKIIKSDDVSVVGRTVIVNFQLIGAPGDTVTLYQLSPSSNVWSLNGKNNIPW